MNHFFERVSHWFLTPISGSSHHIVPPYVAWHGRLMVLGWVVLVPLGIGIARYFKVTPKQDWPRELDNRWWWDAHRIVQYAAMTAMTAGVAVMLTHAGLASTAAQLHAGCGWFVIALGWTQIAAALLRGTKGGPTDAAVHFKPGVASGDHYDMSSRRRLFEYVHKVGGYLALIISTFVVCLGLHIVDAPRWMWILIVAWWLGMLTGAIILQRLGRCIDTYQAIWGPMDDHPGNRLKPIGWGIKRHHAPGSKSSSVR